MVASEWIRGNLRITRSAMAEIERAGRQAYDRDEEACGFIQGPASDPLLATRAVELENLANKYHAVDPEAHPRTGHDYFKINSLKFERALSEGAHSEQPVKVFFHSHLDCGAYFSKEDADSMTMGDGSGPSYELAYLVTAVDKAEVTAHKLFIWDDASKTFIEAPFSVVDD